MLSEHHSGVAEYSQRNAAHDERGDVRESSGSYEGSEQGPEVRVCCGGVVDSLGEVAGRDEALVPDIEGRVVVVGTLTSSGDHVAIVCARDEPGWLKVQPVEITPVEEALTSAKALNHASPEPEHVWELLVSCEGLVLPHAERRKHTVVVSNNLVDANGTAIGIECRRLQPRLHEHQRQRTKRVDALCVGSGDEVRREGVSDAGGERRHGREGIMRFSRSRFESLGWCHRPIPLYQPFRAL
jgi:hypothetical protein